MPYSRVVRAGQYLEITHYKTRKPIGYFGIKKQSIEVIEEKRKTDLSYRLAKNKIRRLVNANYMDQKSSFLTLTYAKNQQDLNVVKVDFLLFIKRLNWMLFQDNVQQIRYLAIYEKQKRGAFHLHVVLFNVPFIPVSEVGRCWGHGFVKLNRMEGCDNVGAYICKYFTKQRGELKNRKLYFRSYNLIEPVEEFYEGVDKCEGLEAVLNNFCALQLRYQKDYKDYFGNDVSYKQYKLLDV